MTDTTLDVRTLAPGTVLRAPDAWGTIDEFRHKLSRYPVITSLKKGRNARLPGQFLVVTSLLDGDNDFDGVIVRACVGEDEYSQPLALLTNTPGVEVRTKMLFGTTDPRRIPAFVPGENA